jgi:hypothetical protein
LTKSKKYDLIIKRTKTNGREPLGDGQNMTTSQIKQDAPSACIVCLNGLNNGRALGKWITAEQAAAEIDAELITYAGQAEPAGLRESSCPHRRLKNPNPRRDFVGQGIRAGHPFA